MHAVSIIDQRSQHLQHHLGRLFSLVDFGVIDAPPHEQVRRIVYDSAVALGASYAEVTGDDEHIAIVTGVHHLAPPSDPLARRIAGGSTPLIIYDTQDDDIATHPIVEQLSLRSVGFWPLQAGDRRFVLALGWNNPHSAALCEEEMKIIDFLASLLSRLLAAAERQRTIERSVETDALTGLLNRAATLEHLDQAMSSVQRNGGKAAVLYIDLDHFKKVNDTHGHVIGDAALTEIARRMRSVLRKHEIAGRLGGDEFAVVVSSFASETELEGLAMRLIRALAAPVIIKGIFVQASASIGIAVAPDDAPNVQDLVAYADRAMYRAKETRNSFAFFDEQSTLRVLPADASFDSQFIFCVQPIIDARTNRPIGGEILPRWLHPDLGLVLPRKFLHSRTDFESLHEFECLVLSTTVKKFGAFFQDHGPLQLFVNISSPHKSLLEINAASATICLEFLESAVAREPDRFIPFIASCRERGYRVGLSDFGGDMPLRTLSQMDFDFVKINSRRPRESQWNTGSIKSLRALVDQAHRMSCSVIAEAVETNAEKELLVASGVDALQGFGICSPLTERDFSNWLHYRTAAT